MTDNEEEPLMKCPRCGGNMSSGVCEARGFPVTGRHFPHGWFRAIDLSKEQKNCRFRFEIIAPKGLT